MSVPKVHVIVVAAGQGSRFGAAVPKQFVEIDGKPVLAHTLLALRRILPQATMAVVLAPAWVDIWRRNAADTALGAIEIISGGDTRYQSVRNAVLAAPTDADYILVHDGARPLVTAEVVNGVIAALGKHVGAVPAVSVTDSLRISDNEGLTSESVDRSKYYAVQTPQGFRAQELREAYLRPMGECKVTDDASVMALAGHTDISLTPGDPDNVKITYPRDLAVMQAVLALRQKQGRDADA